MFRFYPQVNYSADEGSGGTGDQGGTSEGSGDLGWRAALPDNLKNHDLIKGYTKPGEAIQAFVDLHEKAGKMLSIPGENATDDERAAFLKALGRPETADGYTFAKPDGLPDGLPYSEESEKAFKAYFHELGLTDAVAGKLWEKYHEVAAKGQTDRQQEEKAATDKAIETLQGEWKGDTFKANTERAHRTFLKAYEGDNAQMDAAKKFLEETKIEGVAIGNHPMFLRVFAKVGAMIADDSALGDRGVPGKDMSDEARARQRFPNTKFATA